MNQIVDWTQPGVMRGHQGVFKHMQDGFAALLDGLAGHFGDKVIVSGVTNTNGTISNGWVSYGGEILPFTGGGQQPHVEVVTSATDVQYDDGTLKPVLKKKELVMVAVATGTSFPFADLVRPSAYKNQWVKNDIKQHKCDTAYITANFDSTTWEALPTSELYGWKIDLEAGGRVIVGWHPADSQPAGDDAWSVDAHTIGKKFGEILHKLTQSEIPSITWDQDTKTAPQSGNSTQCIIPSNIPGGAAKLKITLPGGDQKHNNMQPSIVYLTLVKI